MKNKLTKDEKSILKRFESGKLKRIKGAQKETRRYKEYAAYTLSKPRNINIRLSQKTFRKIKAVAVRKGLPYQTFISSLIHQYSDKE
ncbi:MAG: antitoxin [Candidatus Taylorbacteria bacterium]|nr:antitoxin [Candidatus Taylorbacteria bacterium]